MQYRKYYTRPEFWAALFFAMIGVFQLISASGISPQILFVTYWPFLFVIVGILQFASHRYRDMISSILLIIAGLTLFVIREKIISEETIRQALPAGLQSIWDWLQQSFFYFSLLG